jgi:hypothetical protein
VVWTEYSVAAIDTTSITFMATTLSSFNPFMMCSPLDFTPFKTERVIEVEDECEISTWLKLENEPVPTLPVSNTQNFFSTPTTYSLAIGSTNLSCSKFQHSFPYNTPPTTQLPLSQYPSYTQANIFSTTTPNFTLNNGFSQSNQQPFSLFSLQAPQPGQLPTSQFYQQLFAQLLGSPSENTTESTEKRKRAQRPFVRRVRQTRPKVVEAKGSIQCKGRNRKKGIQCRNAALMEYIGPRPIYCAEHIELDPKSLYEKCKSPYQKEVGDGKGCKEVVLKEFGFCYKHFCDLLNDLITKGNFEMVHSLSQRVTELLNQLEREAAAAKKKDGDLYQRKNKLIPKFQEMNKLISRVIEEIQTNKHCLNESIPAFEINSTELVTLNLNPVNTNFEPIVVDSLHHEALNCPLFSIS